MRGMHTQPESQYRDVGGPLKVRAGGRHDRAERPVCDAGATALIGAAAVAGSQRVEGRPLAVGTVSRRTGGACQMTRPRTRGVDSVPSRWRTALG